MKRTILIVEDDKEIIFAVSSWLELEGYVVRTAENGFAALEVVKQHGLPHLILLDMIMPVMNGWQFAEKFMSQYDHRAPIVVMSAAPDAKQRAQDIGAIGWIGKPFTFENLLMLIKQYERSE